MSRTRTSTSSDTIFPQTPVPPTGSIHPLLNIPTVRRAAIVILLFGTTRCSSPPPAQPLTPAPSPLPTSAATATQLPAYAVTVSRSESACTIVLGKDPITAGNAKFMAVNDTDTLVAFDTWRIADSATYDQLAAYIENGNDLVEAGEEAPHPPTFVGDLFRIEVRPHESSAAVGRLLSGTYAIVCIQESDSPAGTRPFAIAGPLQVQ